MVTGAKTAIWDFDGTLGHRRYGTWAECLLEVLDAQEPGHRWAFPQMFEALATGFPWHAAQEPHPHLNDPDAWWDHITSVVAQALTRLGISRPQAVAAGIRAAYTDPAAWSLYPQTLHVLDRLTAHGWTHVLLSNHVPELPELLSTLGIDTRFQAVINSAASGYEKPHPQAFQLARAEAGPAHRLVMIGDNPRADAAGARRAGIDAIWVRRDQHTDTPDLDAAARILLTPEPVPNGRRPALHEVPPLQPTAPEALPIR
ncbi:HAD family hydrolase [Streptomyces sp. NBC_01433]|uniref:HAD family hydrolase n=1 Tax=Streptomyces sp. NBC_01433 TaxID=2903864 RepID=UPI002250A065|nr:HAD family hydrolase [Streptomyces sp. NBC_01433]MCX4681508.1 HAD family hydrolase [Streptomyces sp. NBC_01433]